MSWSKIRSHPSCRLLNIFPENRWQNPQLIEAEKVTLRKWNSAKLSWLQNIITPRHILLLFKAISPKQCLNVGPISIIYAKSIEMFFFFAIYLKSNIQIFFLFFRILLTINYSLKQWPTLTFTSASCIIRVLRFLNVCLSFPWKCRLP